jgi:prolyl-tRNA editing enzyme YbaK/EbsC (Cys-tRNA(Pro) deacylase)
MNAFERLAPVMAIARREGLRFEHYPEAYARDVVTCEEAAHARGVGLEQELKHLLLETMRGPCLVHVPATARVSLRKVKRNMHSKHARMADLETGWGGPTARGTICPLVEPFWSLLHLVDDTVLDLALMTTNDSTVHGYVRFDPRLLRFANHVMVGDFIENAATGTLPRTAAAD